MYSVLWCIKLGNKTVVFCGVLWNKYVVFCDVLVISILIR